IHVPSPIAGISSPVEGMARISFGPGAAAAPSRARRSMALAAPTAASEVRTLRRLGPLDMSERTLRNIAKNLGLSIVAIKDIGELLKLGNAAGGALLAPNGFAYPPAAMYRMPFGTWRSAATRRAEADFKLARGGARNAPRISLWVRRR